MINIVVDDLQQEMLASSVIFYISLSDAIVNFREFDKYSSVLSSLHSCLWLYGLFSRTLILHVVLYGCEA